ncbi:hypothetical protein MIND_01328800 [Mycena indigotica]|uniref:Uncharacterized protein n=1 Tax=Mycena indigotica TaxID=2126181 RepID=A0A8H6S177_9AGAR|nr:uncharacterized protein MIND_01328800 [Mycena indigotica]KAF7290156.1 hypothetical protein MIND_01328800 [Mycena indigotica]
MPTLPFFLATKLTNVALVSSWLSMMGVESDIIAGTKSAAGRGRGAEVCLRYAAHKSKDVNSFDNFETLLLALQISSSRKLPIQLYTCPPYLSRSAHRKLPHNSPLQSPHSESTP